MPKTSDAATKQSEHEKPAETEEQVEMEETSEEDEEEEVEYEEVEEEIEEEEEVEEEEEEEEEVEEEEEDTGRNGRHARKGIDSDNDDMDDSEEKKKHAELLALPPQGSEIYLGGFLPNTSEDDLKHFCESIGEVIEVRVMKGKDPNDNKGYAFVTFRTKELATKAIKDLNNKELKGKRLRCSTSQAKNKLFIGNLPRTWGEKDMKKVVDKVGPGVIGIELLKDVQDSSRNRGFVFIEYYNHACAEYSRQKMLNPKFKLDNNAPTVSWADPPKSGESSSSQVKAVYVKNLPKNVTQEQLMVLFERYGEITKVVLPPAKPGKEESRYGFVHFAERSYAMKALANTEKYEIEGQVIECSLAKPQADQKTSGGSNAHKAAILPTYPPRMGYGLVGSPYGALSAGYAGGGFAQPLMYGSGGAPGMAMMPMLLPDGRIGYVLQQPGGLQAHNPPPPQQRGGRGGSSGGRGRSSSGGGRRGSDSGGRGHSRYNPY